MEALKIADKIGRRPRWRLVIQIAAAGYEIFKSEREARKAQLESARQHSAWLPEIMGHADKIAANARVKLWAIIDPPLNEFLSEIQTAQDEILNAEQARGEAGVEIRAIAGEADRLSAETAEGTPTDR